MNVQRKEWPEVSETRCTGELALATRVRLCSEGANDAAIIIKDITTKSPLRAAKYRAAYKSSMEQRPPEMSRDEALVDFVDHQKPCFVALFS